MLPPRSFRQSVLAQFDKCSFAGKLAVEQGQEDEDATPSQATIRGTLFHRMAEEGAREAWRLDECGPLTGDVARALMQDVIKKHPELPVSVEEMEVLRIMAWNWGEAFWIPPKEQVVLAEERLYMPFGDAEVTGAPDLVEWVEPGVIGITDYKTSLAVPTQEEYERKFQPAFYAMLVAHGYYVSSDGEPKVLDSTPKLIRTREVYPRYRTSEGELVQRDREFTMDQIADFIVGVESILGRIAYSYETDDFPAVPGNHCGFCPAANLCPVTGNPYTLRPTTQEEAEQLARRWYRLDEEKKQAFTALRDYARENGHINLNDTHELGFKLVEQEEVRDKEQLKARLKEGGEDLEAHFKKRTSTRFGLIKKEDA